MQKKKDNLGNIFIFAIIYSHSVKLYCGLEAIACRIVNIFSLHWKFLELFAHCTKKLHLLFQMKHIWWGILQYDLLQGVSINFQLQNEYAFRPPTSSPFNHLNWKLHQHSCHSDLLEARRAERYLFIVFICIVVYGKTPTTDSLYYPFLTSKHSAASINTPLFIFYVSSLFHLWFYIRQKVPIISVLSQGINLKSIFNKRHFLILRGTGMYFRMEGVIFLLKALCSNFEKKI